MGVVLATFTRGDLVIIDPKVACSVVTWWFSIQLLTVGQCRICGFVSYTS